MEKNRSSNFISRMSIRTKITLWYSVALIIVVSITYLVILAVSNGVIQKTIRDNLITAVEHNVDEIEYFATLDQSQLANDVDYFLPYKTGYIEVDDDFLDEVNQIYTTLYLDNGAFIYGENPIAEETSNLAFIDSQIRELTYHDTVYYIFDRKLIRKGLEGLWLRGVVSEKQGAVQMASISRTSLVLLPSFLVIAILGGLLIAGRMLRPIRSITESAASIRKGDDLKKRIDIGEGSDELHELADNFNQMFDRLENAFQAERQFTSDASHELRTPMAVILAQCELSLDQECEPDEYVEALTVIQRQGDKMNKLIGDLLDFTRLELKADRYAKEELDLSRLVRSVCADMALVMERGITLTCEVEDGITYLGNAELLTRLLTNLITNAHRYGKDGGKVAVALYRDASGGENAVKLAVSDDGIGIAEEEHEKIFHRFYQSNSSRSEGGTGLGLAMVQEIAKFHGGEVELESELGVGSTFTICL